MAETPTSDREKVSACVEVRGRHSHWIEIEVQDNARDPQSKIDDKAQFHDLVGHTRSSFTGGVSDHQGVLKAAEGGRVAPCLRDEIGDIPLDIQGSQLSRAARARSYPPW